MRALAFDTGGGLDFWVTVDRCPRSRGPVVARHPARLAERRRASAARPARRPRREGGRGLMRSFSGLLVTCGLDHIRQPKDGQPLHGRLPFTPARLTAYGEDWEREEPVLFCRGRDRPGPARWRASAPAPPDRGAGRRRPDPPARRGGESRGRAASARRCSTTSISASRRVATGSRADCSTASGCWRVRSTLAAGERHPRCNAAPWRVAGLAARDADDRRLGRRADRLSAWASRRRPCPGSRLWLDPRPGTCAFGIEPCTSDRLPDGTSGEETVLEPGAVRAYALEISVEG